MVLGGPQILGQMGSACAVARSGTVGPLLKPPVQATFQYGRLSHCAIGGDPVSVAFAATVSLWIFSLTCTAAGRC